MKTQLELNADILHITMEIRKNFPELIKYLEEMTVTIPDVLDPKLTINNLTDYYNSLYTLVKNYDCSHHLA